MLNHIKQLIQEKKEILEAANIIMEDHIMDDIDNTIVLGEDSSSFEDQTPESSEASFENDDVDNEPIDDGNMTGNEDGSSSSTEPEEPDDPTFDPIDDILSSTIDLRSNTLTDALPIPPSNARDAIDDNGEDDIMNMRIDSGFGDDNPPETSDAGGIAMDGNLGEANEDVVESEDIERNIKEYLNISDADDDSMYESVDSKESIKIMAKNLKNIIKSFKKLRRPINEYVKDYNKKHGYGIFSKNRIPQYAYYGASLGDAVSPFTWGTLGLKGKIKKALRDLDDHNNDYFEHFKLYLRLHIESAEVPLDSMVVKHIFSVYMDAVETCMKKDLPAEVYSVVKLQGSKDDSDYLTKGTYRDTKGQASPTKKNDALYEYYSTIYVYDRSIPVLMSKKGILKGVDIESSGDSLTDKDLEPICSEENIMNPKNLLGLGRIDDKASQDPDQVKSESFGGDILNEEITIGGEANEGDTAAQLADTTAGADGGENAVTAAVRDKVSDAAPDVTDEPLDGSVETDGASVGSREEILKKLGNITKSLEDTKNAVLKSLS